MHQSPSVTNEEKEQPTTLAQYLEALDQRDQSIIAWEQFFENWDVLLVISKGDIALSSQAGISRILYFLAWIP